MKNIFVFLFLLLLLLNFFKANFSPKCSCDNWNILKNIECKCCECKCFLQQKNINDIYTINIEKNTNSFIINSIKTKLKNFFILKLIDKNIFRFLYWLLTVKKNC